MVEFSEVWPVIALFITLLVAILSTFGGLILRNRGRSLKLEQRLLGTEGDETDSGFVRDTERRLTEMDQKQQEHAYQTHQQLYRLDQKMEEVIETVGRACEGVDVRSEDVETVPPPPEHANTGGQPPPDYSYRRGGGPAGEQDARFDGGGEDS